VAGGGSSHAAIVARGLGLPMITGVDAAVLAEPGGRHAVLDAVSGELSIGPAGAGPAAGEGTGARAGLTPGRAAAPGGNGQRHAVRPAATIDGRKIIVLCNVASAAETRAGLAAGAAGVGLLRTEIPFTGALAWPTPAEHRAHLAPILGMLAGLPATVRLLDFSGDKIPPFLARRPGEAGAGLAALLAHPTALRDQVRAILEAGRDARLAVLIPMVSSTDEVDQVAAAVSEAAAAIGAPAPRLGIMVELAATAAAAETFAPAVDFFSIGTNDLAGQVLGLDRRDPAARPALAADPRVLGLIGHVTRAARQAGIGVSVCGDAAADAQVLPLLIGLGVDTFSVPAARAGRVRSWVSGLDAEGCADLAARALAAPTVAEVWKLVAAL
jgi:phosphoenolpyruvate-protein kinase (PTS system EI component)